MLGSQWSGQTLKFISFVLRLIEADWNISIADCRDGSEEEEVPAGPDYLSQGRVGAGRGETAAASKPSGIT